MKFALVDFYESEEVEIISRDGYQLLLLAGCFENFRVLSYVFIV